MRSTPDRAHGRAALAYSATTMRTPLLLTVSCALSAAALAAEVDLGVGAALALDMPDRTSKDYARFGPGPSLQIPVRVGLSDYARLRSTLRADFGFGSDRVTWGLEVDGVPLRMASDDHWAMLAAAGLTVGPEVVLPLSGSVRPYLGAEAGGAWVGTYHAFGPEAEILLDPEQNELDNPKNVDPYTTQLAFLTDLHLGATVGTEGVGGWFELGYSAAFLGARPLNKAPESLDAQREAYGWNPIRLAAGVRIPL